VTCRRPSEKSSSLETLGIAADDAGKYGASDTEDAKAITRSSQGEWVTSAMTSQHTAEADSLTIMTRRRSNRSPTAPASGPRKPITAHVSNIVAEIHAVDRVCW
jgi:hypothetical protein